MHLHEQDGERTCSLALSCTPFVSRTHGPHREPAPGGEVESAGSTLSPLHLVAHSSSTTWAEGESWELAITLDQDCPRAASIRVRQGCAQCPILAETPWALSRGHRLEVAVTVSNGTLNGLKVMQS